MTFPHIAVTWYDVIDIVLTAIFVYVVLLLIKGTRAVQILQGVAVVLVLRLIAEAAHLWTMFSILNGLLIASGVAIPVVFQPELRRALAQLGAGRFIEGRPAYLAPSAIDSVCQALGLAASVLSERGVGAIIAVERNTGLEEYVESGRVLDARVSADLLLSIFTPKTPLHDGAVIVRRDRIAAAGCFLPLSDNVELTPRVGTRHRAALGVSEQTDAVALLVSEETGDVEFAAGGRLSRCLATPEEIARRLRSYLRPVSPSAHTSFIDRMRSFWNRSNGAADRFGTTKLRP
jgi:diadenylate cyclase